MGFGTSPHLPSNNQKDPTSSKSKQNITSDEVLTLKLKPICQCANEFGTRRRASSSSLSLGFDDIVYAHLGHARDPEALRQKFTKAWSVAGEQIRIVRVEKVSLG